MSDEKPAIYGLRCPDSGRVMYVGKADDPQKRFKQHIRDRKRSGSAKDAWLCELVDAGKVPGLVVLERADDWEEAERRWIEKFGGTDKLLNVQSGGIPKWAAKTKRAGRWHMKVVARFRELAKQATDGKAARFVWLADQYRAMRDEARRNGLELEYEAHLERTFGEALS